MYWRVYHYCYVAILPPISQWDFLSPYSSCSWYGWWLPFVISILLDLVRTKRLGGIHCGAQLFRGGLATMCHIHKLLLKTSLCHRPIAEKHVCALSDVNREEVKIHPRKISHVSPLYQHNFLRKTKISSIVSKLSISIEMSWYTWNYLLSFLLFSA